MPQIQAELFDRAFRTVIPADLSDPPLFAQVSETTKDVFLLSLRQFFTRSQESGQRLGEAITLDKYNIQDTGGSPYEAVVQILRKYPDVLEHLPHVAVLNTSGKEHPFTVGPPFIAQVQAPPQLVAANPEPYALSDGLHLDLYTSPGLKIGQPQAVGHTSVLTFSASRFPVGNPIGAALAVDVARVINEQALYVTADVLTIGGLNYLRIVTGGALANSSPNAVEVASSTSPTALTVLGLGRSGAGTAASLSGVPTTGSPTMTFVSSNLAATPADVGRYLVLSGSTSPYRNNGRFPITAVNSSTSVSFTSRFGVAEAFPSGGSWFIGNRDDSLNAARPPANRYGYSWDSNVEIHILANDDNTRDEVSDLVSSYLAFFLEQQYFTFEGRSLTDPTVVGENYQIVLNRDMSHSGGTEIVRGESGKDKVYVDAFSFTCNVSLYVDRNVLVQSGPSVGQPWILTSSSMSPDDTLPLGS